MKSKSVLSLPVERFPLPLHFSSKRDGDDYMGLTFICELINLTILKRGCDMTNACQAVTNAPNAAQDAITNAVLSGQASCCRIGARRNQF